MRTWLSLLFVCLITQASFGQSLRTDYEVASAQAESQDKVLLVLAGASWCAPCQTMKAEIAGMQGELRNVAVPVYLDKDKEPGTFNLIKRGESIPQIIAYRKGLDGWKRYALTGIQTRERLRELIKTALGK